MKNTLVFTFLMALTFTSPAAFAKAKKLSHDFYVSEAPANFKPKRPIGLFSQSVTTDGARLACAAVLEKALCETNASSDEIAYFGWNNVKCLAGGEKYLPAFLEFYDEMPAKMRDSFCTVEKIFISDRIESVAFAGAIQSRGQVVGGYLGFRKASFLKQPKLGAIVTWKEQRAFGGSSDYLSNDPSLVQIDYGLKLSNLSADGVFYVLMHELGHLIHFLNEDDLAADFPQISWQSSSRPKKDAAFKYQDEICYYDCDSYLSPSFASEMYRSLGESAFITAYSGVNPYEDFAEFWAWRMMLAEKSAHYVIEIPGSGTIDMNLAIQRNTKMQGKILYMQQLWDSPNLRVRNK